MREISEPDWRVLRRLHPLALERFCERVLAEIDRVSRDGAPSHHARYLQIFRILQQRDREMARLFDNPRRSHALTMLAWILAGIFNPQINLREHRYFGSPLKDRARFLFDFWANARRGDGAALQRCCLSNIRITTFFAGEWEAKIVDPSRISQAEAVGCEVDFAPTME